MRKFLYFLVYTNVIVSLSTGMLGAGFAFMLGLEHWLVYGLLIMFGTYVVYNGQRLVKSGQKAQTPWLDWVRANEKPLVLSVFAGGLGAISAVLNLHVFSWKSLLVLGLSSLISIFYVVRLRGINCLLYTSPSPRDA